LPFLVVQEESLVTDGLGRDWLAPVSVLRLELTGPASVCHGVPSQSTVLGLTVGILLGICDGTNSWASVMA
jgi:hypothetical protein